MEKIAYDFGVDEALKVIESRIDYYDMLILEDKADMLDFEIIKELECLKDLISKLKNY